MESIVKYPKKQMNILFIYSLFKHIYIPSFYAHKAANKLKHIVKSHLKPFKSPLHTHTHS